MTFLVLKPEYPHGSASNSLFDVKKGEILECPKEYEPSDSFQICDTEESAREYIKLTSLKEGGKGTVAKRDKKAEEGGSQHTVVYPLFRKVSGLGDEETEYQLFSRDIHRFLSREETEIITDMENVKMHYNTASRILEYERAHFTREKIMTILERTIKSEERKSDDSDSLEKKA
jgi:hypothetical protein